MDFLKILNLLEERDPEMSDRLNTRRQALKDFANLGKKLSMAAVPVAMGSMFQKAYGQSTATVVDVLNYALTLEYLEYRFYEKALASTGLIPTGAPNGAITTIMNHEKAHVDFLKQAITSAGGTPVAEPTFDFSGGQGTGNGPFASAFSNYQLFLAVAQALEDTGVRAYKGQAGNLVKQNAVLTAALNIHSVEARHASHIRQMRKANGASVKPWITGKESGIDNSVVQAIYNGEENTTQGEVNITSLGSISANVASEAFDEPLTKEQVLAVATLFLAS
ncbi:ferritin-like domain-containing protein [Runella sp. MFBS21]|uniref:ferritin-like domain-containing protein n=1 Tax=Runella sp. MFBS21 TaxID=3034018 RepID=UPI0023F7E228|nr:ferritin-like domain-containing protein [Runella sp. MFBS21]MDF7819585.1 ferritin-like domain-containing protein [Runella sp. MFBS21]